MRFFIEREDTKKQSSFLCDSVSLRLNFFQSSSAYEANMVSISDL